MLLAPLNIRRILHGAMASGTIVSGIIWVILLSIYAIAFVFFTKKTYDWMLNRGIAHDSAVYYNRKFIHIFAGGVIALLVPFVFPNPWYPLFCGMSITLLTYVSHKRGNAFYWFQTKKDLNDVNFCFMWGITLFVLWSIFKDPFIAIIPVVFMAFGDGITGIVRNKLFAKRTKHPIGNVFMLIVCVPLGVCLATPIGLPIWGAIAAVVASIVERHEYGIIDDNVLITVFSSAVLYIGSIIGPMVYL